MCDFNFLAEGVSALPALSYHNFEQIVPLCIKKQQKRRKKKKKIYRREKRALDGEITNELGLVEASQRLNRWFIIESLSGSGMYYT